MDQILIDYLKSGKAWVLVGSGPSVEMGYPTWKNLAEAALREVQINSDKASIQKIESNITKNNFPMAFENAKKALGGPRLFQVLENSLRPSKEGVIYELIAKWPVPVYLTTNYDNEISKHLAAKGETYLDYSSTEDHFAYLIPSLEGAVVKIHGDLRTEKGLILTHEHYQKIMNHEGWNYWRTKMTSLFQMIPIIIIGHSLSDPNIKHILSCAKAGSGVAMPICWIAPDEKPDDIRTYLEKYRIRIISYSNTDGSHRNLRKLIEMISDFLPDRLSITLSSEVIEQTESPLGNSAASPGFFVYNKLSTFKEVESKRKDVVLSVIEAVIPELKKIGTFDLNKALNIAGWPEETILETTFRDELAKEAVNCGLLITTDNKFFIVNPASETLLLEKQKNFEHLRSRFIQSLYIRLKRDYQMLSDSDAEQVALDIEKSIINYFQKCGLTFASLLFSQNRQRKIVPTLILRHLKELSARYDDFLKRQAFIAISIDAFARAESAEKEYLGRISHGFLAFHAFGVFGDLAAERLEEAKKTVWVVDSNVQIYALALQSSFNSVYRNMFKRLKELGIRFFSTESLLSETSQHLWFASDVIKKHGPDSREVLAAAAGDLPYRKSNEFLQGFLNWQAAGNAKDWEAYMYSIFNSHKPTRNDMSLALVKLGIEVFKISDWPGFQNIRDFGLIDQYIDKISEKIRGYFKTDDFSDLDSYFYLDSHKKAKPEAEAMLIVKNERDGKYYMLSDNDILSPSWFISQTSLLNIIEPGLVITWQPVAFVQFSSSLISTPPNTFEAFQTILMNIAQSGISLLDDKVISAAFGGVIDEIRLNLKEQKEKYQASLGDKYGESIETVLDRLPLRYQPLAAVQLADERAQVEEEKRRSAEKDKIKAERKTESLECELRKVEKFRIKMQKKKQVAKSKDKKQKARSKSNKRKKRRSKRK